MENMEENFPTKFDKRKSKYPSLKFFPSNLDQDKVAFSEDKDYTIGSQVNLYELRKGRGTP